MPDLPESADTDQPSESPEVPVVPPSTPNDAPRSGEATSSEAVSATEPAEPDMNVKVPEFATMQEKTVPAAAAASSVERFYDVNVPVWAELGRVEMPLGELMKLGEGSVLRLDRPVSEPVDLVSQGVKLARGEVVVVDDCFAIRIKEIEPPK